MKIFLLLLSLSLALFAKERYQLGDGVQIASSPIYVGGYFSLNYRHTQAQDRYQLDDIALLSYASYKKFSYMVEVEYKDLYTKKEYKNNTITTKDTALYLERLYIDYTFNENYRCRIGKYISPIGFWNLLPINVLRSTTSDPVSTNILFPELTTGFYLSYTQFALSNISIDIMLQNNEDLDHKYNNYQMNKHYGIGFTYTKNNFSSKINIGYFNKLHRYQEDDGHDYEEVQEDNHYENENYNTTEDLYYILVSMRYETENLQIQSELGHQESSLSPTTPYAFYLQGLYKVAPHHTAILRLESYNDKIQQKQETFSVFGYNYRPLFPVAFKAELQIHPKFNDNKFLCSLSVLF